jgi:hypothetical protein
LAKLRNKAVSTLSVVLSHAALLELAAVLHVGGFGCTGVIGRARRPGENVALPLRAAARVYSVGGAKVGVMVLDKGAIGLGVRAEEVVGVFTLYSRVRAEDGIRVLVFLANGEAQLILRRASEAGGCL